MDLSTMTIFVVDLENVLILCSKGGHLQPVPFPMLPLLLSLLLAFMQHHSRLLHHQK